MTWREVLILNGKEAQTGVNVKSVCLYVRGNVPVGMSGIFWKKKIEVEAVDCVSQHMDFDVTCLNPSVLAASYVAFTPFKGIGDRVLDSFYD